MDRGLSGLDAHQASFVRDRRGVRSLKPPTPLCKQHWALVPSISGHLRLLGRGGGGVAVRAVAKRLEEEGGGGRWRRLGPI